jgi:CBS domain-containing protein
MSIGQFCVRDTVIVKKDDTIVEAAKVMREHHVGSVVVVEESGGGCKPLGILTDRVWWSRFWQRKWPPMPSPSVTS